MRLNEIQRLEQLNAARRAAGHSPIEITALGERTRRSTDVAPCACSALCAAPSIECGGQVTVVLPGAWAQLHLCEIHLSQLEGGPPTPALPREIAMPRWRFAVITDWRTPEADLPDVPPGEIYEHVITPQKHCFLHRVIVRDDDFVLVGLQIGITAVPFDLYVHNNVQRVYTFRCTKHTTCEAVKAAAHGDCAECTCLGPALLAGMDVRITLCNRSTAPAKLRAALMVREEVPIDA